jgi:hypothetical protein
LLHPFTKVHIMRRPNSSVGGDPFHVNSVGFTTIKMDSFQSFAAVCIDVFSADFTAVRIGRQLLQC